MVSKSLDNVWKHVQEYPQGIVARTVKSMGIFNENWKKYVRPEPRVDLNKALDFKTESLNKLPSIHKPWPKRSPSFSFQPSNQVLETQLLNRERTAGLREANKVARRTLAHETAQLNELAKTLETIIDSKAAVSSSFRQAEQEEPGPTQSASDAAKETGQHALSTASVKDGVPSLSINRGTYNQILNQSMPGSYKRPKGSAESCFNTQIQLRHLRSRMQSQMEEEAAISKNVQPQVLPERTSAQELDASSEQSIALDTPANVPEPVFTPDGSPVWNDEHPPPVLRAQESLLFSVCDPDIQ